MTKAIEVVLMRFAEGKPKKDKTIRTDGKSLWSYDLLIARKNEKDGIDLVLCRPELSHTTRKHIRAVEDFFAPGSIDMRFDIKISSNIELV